MMTKIVGLTGGIGSGKTTVAKIFSELGVSVYIADEEARKITNLTETLQAIKMQFGDEMVVNNQLNRTLMAELVFSNPDQLKVLNAIIHPRVAVHFNNWLSSHADEVFVIKETAILFETKSYLNCDLIITVIAPVEERVKRVMNREAISEIEIRNRMLNQWTDEQRTALSDFIICNTDLDDTRKQVLALYNKIVSQLSNI